MENQKLFPWLVEYSKKRNFDPLKGILLDQTPIPEVLQKLFLYAEGAENKIAKGVAIFANGDRLLKELIRREIVGNNHVSAPVPVKNKEQLFAFLDDQIHEDGVIVYDGKNEEMVRVYSMQNNISNVAHMFPRDAITYFGQREVTEGDIGNKARLALWITSMVSDSQAYLIKRTVFGPNPGTETRYEDGNVDLGDGIRHVKLGSVQLVKKGRIEQTLSFIQAPQSRDAPYLDEESKLVGVLRQYAEERGRTHRVSEKVISPEYFALN